jgi:hypothetical protein
MMLHAMLEPVTSGSATIPEEIFRYVNSFLISSDADAITMKKVYDATKQALAELATHQGPKSGDEHRQLIIWDREKQKYIATVFGKAVMYSGLTPEVAIRVMVG